MDSSTNFQHLEDALRSSKDGLSPPPRNDRERDGAIQRFEYTFELTWKTAKRVLESAGITSTSPKSVIRDLAQQGWIDDAKLWFDFLDARNETSHLYDEKVAKKIFDAACRFPEECERLIKKLKAELRS